MSQDMMLEEALADDRLRNALKKILAKESELRKKYPDKPSWWIWKLSEVGLRWHTLSRLMELNIVENVYSSSRNKYFRLVDYDTVKRELERYEKLHKTQPRKKTCNPVPSSPDDLFEVVVGYEDYKWVVWKALRKWEAGYPPAHFLLVGPPASGKTMFLESIERAIGCVEYVAGEAARRGGLTTRIYKAYQNYGDRFILLIDEIDKMDFDALKVLYNLMEGKLNFTVKGKMLVVDDVRIMVLATANKIKGIPEAVLSRFGSPLVFRNYTKEEYIRVVGKALPLLEGVPEELARYIAIRTAEKGIRDPRVARQIARIAETREDVDRVMKIMMRNGKLANLYYKS